MNGLEEINYVAEFGTLTVHILLSLLLCLQVSLPTSEFNQYDSCVHFFLLHNSWFVNKKIIK